MKKKSIRTSLFTLIILISLASHTYLNSLSIPDCGPCDPLKIEQVDVEDLANQQNATLPEVKIVKKAFQFLQKMLPVPQ